MLHVQNSNRFIHPCSASRAELEQRALPHLDEATKYFKKYPDINHEAAEKTPSTTKLGKFVSAIKAGWQTVVSTMNGDVKKMDKNMAKASSLLKERENSHGKTLDSCV